MQRRVLLMIVAIWLLGIVLGASIGIRGWNSLLANRDFASFWMAGKLAASGNAVFAYDLDRIRAEAFLQLGTTSKIAFPYPPHTFFVAVPLSLVPYKLSFWLWQAISALLFCFAARAHVPSRFSPLLGIVTPAALINIAFGQVGLFLGALWLLAFSGSSIAIAALTFKPHLGFLAGAEAIRRKQLVRTTLAVTAIILLSMVVFGPGVWKASLVGGAASQINMLAGGQMDKWPTQMVTPLLAYGMAGWAVFAGLAAILLWRNFNVFTAATATFLIAPYGFHYDMTVVCLGFGLLLFTDWDRLRIWQRLVVMLAFLSPGLVAMGSWLVPPLLLAGLYVQTSCKEPARPFTA